MSRRFALVLLPIFFGWFLVACTISKPAEIKRVGTTSNTASPARSISTKTPSATIVPTSSLIQTATVSANPLSTMTPTTVQMVHEQTLTALAYPPAATLTPTPTFDIHSIRISTPAPAEKCPQPQIKQVPTLEYNGQLLLGAKDSVYLNYLNQFGSEAFIRADQSTRNYLGRLDPHIILNRDLTNDGVPEIVVSFGQFYIFGCQNGKYQTLLASEASVHMLRQSILAINDLNQNGIPELLVLEDTGTQADSTYELFEWGNGKFNSLFSSTDRFTGGDTSLVWVLAGGTFRFEDVDQDGMKEIVLHDGVTLDADYYGSAPFRRITKYYKWNGQRFALAKKVFDPPQYRFQAVEDADYAVLAGDYDRALALYQRVIFDDQLDWWTDERMEYIIQNRTAGANDQQFFATPPAPDPNEYLYLSAYARYRIMVLHLMRGYESDAQVVYQTLQKKYPVGTPGSIYSQMAQAFWENYAKTRDIKQACGPARAVAIENEQEAVRYFLDDYVYDGYPKADYTIGQLCPFR